MKTATRTDGMVGSGTMPRRTILGMQEPPACRPFQSHEQRFRIAYVDGWAFLSVDGGVLNLDKSLQLLVDDVRIDCGGSVTHWHVSRKSCCVPTVHKWIDGEWIRKTSGPIVEYLLKLADEGGISDPIDAADAELIADDEAYDRRIANEVHMMRMGDKPCSN